MALFASNFYQPQNISAPTSNLFQQPTFNNILPNNNPHSNPHRFPAMKRRRGVDDNEPQAKRTHYEERMAHRLNSLDLSNENPLPPVDIMDDELAINEIDPEILDDHNAPSSSSVELEQPIIEEPEEEDRIILSNELHRYMKNINDHNLLSKFQNKKGTELVLWRPLPTSNIIQSSSPSSSSLNDRIAEVADEDNVDDGIRDISDGIGQSHVTFPDESTSSSRSSTSPPIIFSPKSDSSSSSNDGQCPTRMPTNFVFPQNQQQDYEPMEMD